MAKIVVAAKVKDYTRVEWTWASTGNFGAADPARLERIADFLIEHKNQIKNLIVVDEEGYKIGDGYISKAKKTIFLY